MTKYSRFFEDCREAFIRAREGSGASTTRSYKIAGIPVEVEFATGPSFDQLSPALRHLEVSGEEAETSGIVIQAWDQESSGVALPECPWDSDSHLTRGDIKGISQDESIKVAFGLGVNALSLWDEENQRGLFHLTSTARIPQVFFGSPFLNLFHWIGAPRGIRLVHAGAVGWQGQSVLLVGRGGAGKSTTCLAALHEGLDYLADDYCFVQAGATSRVYSAYSSGKIHPHHLDDLPEFRETMANPQELDREKALLFLEPKFSQQIQPQSQLGGIVTPRVTESLNSSVEPAPRGAALRALGASSVFQMAGAGESYLKDIGRTVRSLPVYYLNLGSSLKGVASELRALIQTLGDAS